MVAPQGALLLTLFLQIRLGYGVGVERFDLLFPGIFSGRVRDGHGSAWGCFDRCRDRNSIGVCVIFLNGRLLRNRVVVRRFRVSRSGGTQTGLYAHGGKGIHIALPLGNADSPFHHPGPARGDQPLGRFLLDPCNTRQLRRCPGRIDAG